LHAKQGIVIALDVAERLRAARLLAGKTLLEVAGDVGVSEATVSRWETGDREPRIEQLRALGKVYGLSVSALLGERRKVG
jgi:transcriptional regulator with XRE-family HTH domain